MKIGSVMEIEKEREEFEKEAFKQSGGWATFHKAYGDVYENNQLNFAWKVWLEAKQQTTPDGFVLVPVKEIKTWFLDESENIYREDPDWLCDIPIGEVVEVEHRVSYELEQDPVFAAIQWDEINGDVGNYETFDTKEEAEKAAARCKAMIEAQEQRHDSN